MKYIFCFKACLSAKGSSELLLYMISKLMTVKQLAEQLRVSKWTVYRWIKRGKIKAVRLGSKTIRIDEEEARRLMKQS
jgi:excisionase family DNA binding protein